MPAEVTLHNYARALTHGRFGLHFLNSAVVAVATTTGTVLCASLLSYTLARIDFPMRRFHFLLVMYVAMDMPTQTSLMRGFLVGIPADLKESAFIDGASRLRVWGKIMLPLS